MQIFCCWVMFYFVELNDITKQECRKKLEAECQPYWCASSLHNTQGLLDIMEAKQQMLFIKQNESVNNLNFWVVHNFPDKFFQTFLITVLRHALALFCVDWSLFIHLMFTL